MKHTILTILTTTLLTLSLLALCWQVRELARCWHGIAEPAYRACRADPTCLKPMGFKPEPAECRQ